MAAGVGAGRVTAIRSVPTAGARGGAPAGRRTAPESASRATSAAQRATARRPPRTAVGAPASIRQPTVTTAAPAASAAPATGRAQAAFAKNPAPPTAHPPAPRRVPSAARTSSPAAATPIAGQCRQPAGVARAQDLRPWPARHVPATRTANSPHSATLPAAPASATLSSRADRTPTARRSSSAAMEPAAAKSA